MSGEDNKLAGTNECDITDRYLGLALTSQSPENWKHPPDYRAIND